jgi:ATP-dependent DNA ligase
MSQLLETKLFDPLFGTSKVGKTKHWKISVERYPEYSEIVTLHGYDNMVESRRRISQGKNLNKSNQTTHFEQATSEALSKWTKKKEVEKYEPSTSSLPCASLPCASLSCASLPCASSLSPPDSSPYPPSPSSSLPLSKPSSMQMFLPMLAQDYQKHKKKVKFPCYVQPKLDGYRMLFDTSKQKITTRQGKDFPIVKQTTILWKELCSLPPGYILDGELYVHGVDFESLGVLRKTKKLSEQDLEQLAQIEYHVYDLDDLQCHFEKRSESLQSLISTSFQRIKYVPTFPCSSEIDIKNYHEVFTKDNYEGTMVRNRLGYYLEKNRSYDLLKYKDFMDAEFEIVGYGFEKDTSGEDRNSIVWIVKTDKNVECHVRPKGVKEQRQELYELCEKDFSKFKGRKLWTKFFDYTADGSLRFPTTKTSDVKSYIRDEVL